MPMTRVPGSVEDRPAVAAGPEGGVDIDAAVARSKHLDRLAAKDGNMTRGQPDSCAGSGHGPG